MVNLDQYRTLFVVVTLGLALIVASPMLAMVVSFGVSSERFSEFWLLGPNHVAEDFPFNVSAGEVYSVFVGVGNHMGSSEYYKVYVKFGNSSLLFFNSSKPSSLSPVYEYRFFVGVDEIWESPVSFGFGDVIVEDEVLSVGKVVIDGMAFPVDASTSWNSETSGFYFQLFFELWRYDASLKSFRFDDRSVGIQLNMTSS
jgi:uncharacterized membrane protein